MKHTRSTTSRRKTLKSTAYAFGVATTGIGALAFGSQSVSGAEVTADFTVPDAGYKDDNPPYSAVLTANGEWSYEGLEADPNLWRVSLRVGKSFDNQDLLAETEGVPFGFDDSGSFALQGVLVDTAAFTTDDFVAPEGESKTLEVFSTVVFEVLDGDFVLAKAEAQDSGTLTLEDDTLTYSASLDAQGSWEWMQNEPDEL